MANRRMFSKTITNSSQFLMMPQSSQNLYFHLGMNSDDDGFCEHFAIMRMTDSKPDDLKVLQAKSFVQVFDDKVLVIKDWKENNYIQADRYTPSKYLEIYKEELKMLSSGIHDVYKVDTQVRLELGKDRLEIGKNTNTSEQSSQVSEIIHLFEEVNPACKKMYGNKTQRKACQDLLDTYGFDEVKQVISILPRSNKMPYFPNITTPLLLWQKYQQLKDRLVTKKQEMNKNKIYGL